MTKRTTLNCLNEAHDNIKKDYWALHKKLGTHSYGSAHNQMQDMLKLGMIAKSLEAVKIALSNA